MENTYSGRWEEKDGGRKVVVEKGGGRKVVVRKCYWRWCGGDRKVHGRGSSSG